MTQAVGLHQAEKKFNTLISPYTLRKLHTFTSLKVEHSLTHKQQDIE